ncbi:hypothetical protein CEXT_236821, partial [Caerostris extrusa]
KGCSVFHICRRSHHRAPTIHRRTRGTLNVFGTSRFQVITRLKWNFNSFPSQFHCRMRFELRRVIRWSHGPDCRQSGAILRNGK